MNGSRSYIVRIYRQGFASLVGVVEDIATTGARSFSTLEELDLLLRQPIAPAPAPVPSKSDDDPFPGDTP